jgi:hypothetical protein
MTDVEVGVPTATEGTDERHAESDARAPSAKGATALAVAGISAVVAVPVVIATAAVRTPRWYPLVDLSQIEMRVRDVGFSHPPLIGLGGRIFGLDTQGSHPGPISFYLLAPVYRLFGSSSWALQASAAVLDLVLIAAIVWVAHRRAGLRGALVAGAGLALLLRMYGTVPLVYPWNPYMPVLFWALFLVCVWAVLCGDLPLLPVAVVAGTVCAQTHVPYIGLVGGIAVLVAVALVLAWRAAGDDAAARRRLLRWTGGSLALGALLWLPVFVEQLGGDPGNLSVIVDSVRHPPEPEVGLRTAWDLLLRHVDAVQLVQGDRAVEGSSTTGLLTLLAWGASAAAAWRMRRGHPALVRLHVTVAAALVLGLVSISRIPGTPWFYLTLWAYGTAILLLVAVVATVALAIAGNDRVGAGAAARVPPGWAERAPALALAVAIALPTALLARQAPDTEDSDAAVSEQLGRVVGPTVAAIESGELGAGPDDTFLVTWDDPVYLGGAGYGLMTELERRGYEVRAPEYARLGVRPHRLADEAEVDAVIHVAAGTAPVEHAQAAPDLREIAFDDGRSGDEVAAYDRLRDRIVRDLEAAGLTDLVAMVDAGNLITVSIDERLPESLKRPLLRLGSMPRPLGVYTREATP